MKKCLLSLIFLVSYGHNAFASAGPADAKASKSPIGQPKPKTIKHFDPDYDPDYDSGMEDLEGPEANKIRAQYRLAAKHSPEAELLVQAPELLGKSFTALFHHAQGESITLRAQNKVLKKILIAMLKEQDRQGAMLNELYDHIKKQTLAESPVKYIPIQVQPRSVAAAQNPMAQAAKDANK